MKIFSIITIIILLTGCDSPQDPDLTKWSDGTFPTNRRCPLILKQHDSPEFGPVEVIILDPEANCDFLVTGNVGMVFTPENEFPRNNPKPKPQMYPRDR